jgi:hypothetical protein
MKSLVILAALPLLLAQTAYAQTQDWILTVHLLNVPLSNVHVDFYGSNGLHLQQDNNGIDTVLFSIGGVTLPAGSTFKVCATTTTTICQSYTHGDQPGEDATLDLG